MAGLPQPTPAMHSIFSAYAQPASAAAPGTPPAEHRRIAAAAAAAAGLQRPGTADSFGAGSYTGDGGEDELPQALEILASLQSLGIAPALRDRVQQALAELTQNTAPAADGPAAGAGTTQPPGASGAGALPAQRGSGVPSTSGRGAGAGSGREAALQRRVAELEQKMAMSRSIMKKLYHKSVALEKEAALLKVRNACAGLPAGLWHSMLLYVRMHMCAILAVSVCGKAQHACV